MQTLFQDLRYGARMLAKKPGFTFIAILTLALGIGANTAIFSIVNAVLLRPLPFHEPDNLVLLWQKNSQHTPSQMPFAFPNFNDIREQNQSFENIAAWSSYLNTQFNLTGEGQPLLIQYALVSADFFPVFGVQPILGQTFAPEDDQPGSNRIAVISYGLWQSRFAADKKIVGQTITLDGNSYTVKGVMPQSFAFPRFPKDAEIWIPLAQDPNFGRRFSPATRYLNVLARLKPGVQLQQAQSEMDSLARQIQETRPQFNREMGIQATLLHQQVTGAIAPALLVLLVAVGLVLLIACANVANLMLARAMSRQKEIAIRAALGASRWRIFRQLLTESLVLAFAGCLLGLFIALWAVDLFAFVPYNQATYLSPYTVAHHQITLDERVLLFSITLSLLTGILFGIAPAWQFSKPNVNSALKDGKTRTASGFSLNRLRGLLVVSEVALSLVLLIGAGLMIKSFLRLQNVDPGFNPENVLTAQISLPRSKYDKPEKITAFYQQLFERLANSPGVQSIGAISSLPLSNTDNDTSFFIDGQPTVEPQDRPRTHDRTVSPDYFQAMGIKVLQGRSFTDYDNATGKRVALINEAMAQRYWGDENPVGKRIALDYETMRFFTDRPPEFNLAAGMREIVGVVHNIKHTGLESETQPEMYVPYLQHPEREMSFVVRSTLPPDSLVKAVRNEVQNIDADQSLANVQMMTQMLSDSVAKPRFNFLLLGIFAALALALAMLGVYGVMSYSVTQRTNEIGVRMALGAQSHDVMKLFIQQGMWLALAGVAIGLAAAFALTRLMKNLLFGVSTADSLTFIVVSLLLMGVALVACFVPARRAAKTDPMVALRYE